MWLNTNTLKLVSFQTITNLLIETFKKTKKNGSFTGLEVIVFFNFELSLFQVFILS